VGFCGNLCEITVFCHNCFSSRYKVVCVNTPGEVDSFNTHCSPLIAAATCQILWKFVNNF